MRDFLDVLFGDERGWCFACNILDSIDQGLFPTDRFRQLMSNVRCAFANDPAARRSAGHAIGLVAKVASGLYAGHPQRHVMAGIIDNPPPVGRLAHAFRVETFAHWMLDVAAPESVDPHLTPVPTSPHNPSAKKAWERYTEKINEKVEKDPSSVFHPQATLGPPDHAKACEVGLVWLTLKNAVEHCLDSGDSLRDVLGLDAKPGTLYIIVTIDDEEIHKRGVARPTFADGGSPRFRVASDRPPQLAGWGTTVDLCALRRGDNSIDGAPERIALTSPLRNLKPQFLPVGWVSQARGDSSSDSDEAFKVRMLRGRTEAAVRTAIEDLLK